VKRGTLFVALAVVLLVSSSPLAADSIIQRGVDVFTTTDNGKTFYDFANNPIPAGFFCNKSAPFTGRIAFKGLPLETNGYLRGADTVIERLDDAVFNAEGTAVTRLQFKALSLVSIAPVRTACGAYHAYVSLAGKQRVTKMSIHRTQAGGGTFVAPLAVNVRVTFVPVKPAKGRSPRKLELTGSFTFPAAPIPWSLKGGESTRQIDSAVVDTNGDLAPDTLLRGTPNFWPGWAPDGVKQQVGAYCYQCQPESCHTDPSTGKTHCSGPVYACGEEICP
jgi:hypothetical protein